MIAAPAATKMRLIRLNKNRVTTVSVGFQPTQSVQQQERQGAEPQPPEAVIHILPTQAPVQQGVSPPIRSCGEEHAFENHRSACDGPKGLVGEPLGSDE